MKKNQCGVYLIKNKIDGKCYVGSSFCIRSRWAGHLHQLRRNAHHSPKLQNAWNRHGEESFELEILEECNRDKEFILKLEQFYLDTKKPFYNICKKAYSRLGSKAKHETIEKVKGFTNAFSADGKIIKVRTIDYYTNRMTCPNTGMVPVYDGEGNGLLVKKDDSRLMDGSLKHVSCGLVTAIDVRTGNKMKVSKKEFDSNNDLVGINFGRSGRKNYNAKTIKIFDKNDNVIHVCSGTFKTFCEQNNFPFFALRESYLNDGKRLYQTSRQKTFAKKSGYINFEGWYARIVVL